MSNNIEARERFETDLTNFIVQAGQHGWAAEAERVEPQRPGFKEIAYSRDEWEYRDSYAGYFMAPGSSVVYYKDQPVWYMTYGGRGQMPEHFDEAKETFGFLRKALMRPDRRMPVRGPDILIGDTYNYMFHPKGDLLGGSWQEQIWREDEDELVFKQKGDVGIIIPKGNNREPVYPWDL